MRLGDIVSPGDILGTCRESLRCAIRARCPNLDEPEVGEMADLFARAAAQSLVAMTVPGGSVDRVRTAMGELYAEACAEISALRIDLKNRAVVSAIADELERRQPHAVNRGPNPKREDES